MRKRFLFHECGGVVDTTDNENDDNRAEKRRRKEKKHVHFYSWKDMLYSPDLAICDSTIIDHSSSPSEGTVDYFTSKFFFTAPSTIVDDILQRSISNNRNDLSWNIVEMRHLFYISKRFTGIVLRPWLQRKFMSEIIIAHRNVSGSRDFNSEESMNFLIVWLMKNGIKTRRLMLRNNFSLDLVRSCTISRVTKVIVFGEGGTFDRTAESSSKLERWFDEFTIGNVVIVLANGNDHQCYPWPTNYGISQYNHLMYKCYIFLYGIHGNWLAPKLKLMVTYSKEITNTLPSLHDYIELILKDISAANYQYCFSQYNLDKINICGTSSELRCRGSLKFSKLFNAKSMKLQPTELNYILSDCYVELRTQADERGNRLQIPIRQLKDCDTFVDFRLCSIQFIYHLKLEHLRR